MSEIRLVVFDLGRVLVRLCDGWEHACELAGVTAAGAARPRELSAAAEAGVHAAVCAHEVGDTDLAAFAGAAAAHLGIPAADFVAIHKVWTRGPYPGAAQLLDDLRAAGVTTACLSNTNAAHWEIMSDPAAAGAVPLEKLTHRFASHLLRMRKPDDRIYAHVEQATGVEPGAIVFFDDIEENIAAAARRGWRAHRIAINADPIAQVRRHLRALGIDVSES